MSNVTGARGRQSGAPLEGAGLTRRARQLLSVDLPVSSVLWEVGVAQSTVARMAEVTQSRVSRILRSPKEARKQGFDASTRVYTAISKLLGIPLSDLVEYRAAFGDRPHG